jgi:hypothetical protein
VSADDDAGRTNRRGTLLSTESRFSIGDSVFVAGESDTWQTQALPGLGSRIDGIGLQSERRFATESDIASQNGAVGLIQPR